MPFWKRLLLAYLISLTVFALMAGLILGGVYASEHFPSWLNWSICIFGGWTLFSLFIAREDL